MTIIVYYDFDGDCIQEYDYEVEIRAEDIIDYSVSPSIYKSLNRDAFKGFTLAVKELLEMGYLDDLEHDEGFIDYIHDKYEDEAYDEYLDFDSRGEGE